MCTVQLEYLKKKITILNAKFIYVKLFKCIVFIYKYL